MGGHQFHEQSYSHLTLEIHFLGFAFFFPILSMQVGDDSCIKFWEYIWVDTIPL